MVPASAALHSRLLALEFPVLSMEAPSIGTAAWHSQQVARPAPQQPLHTLAVLIWRKLHTGVFNIGNKETRYLRQKIELC